MSKEEYFGSVLGPIYYKKKWWFFPKVIIHEHSGKDPNEINQRESNEVLKKTEKAKALYLKILEDSKILDPKNMPKKKLKALCDRFDIPYYWVTGEIFKQKKNRNYNVIRAASEVERKLPPIKGKDFRSLLPFLSPQVRLIANILWYVNKTLKRSGNYITLQEVLRLQDYHLIVKERMLDFFRSQRMTGLDVPEKLFNKILKLANASPFFVFCNSRGVPLSLEYVAREFKKASCKAKKAGKIKTEITPTSLRFLWNAKEEQRRSSFPVLTDEKWKKIKPLFEQKSVGTKPKYSQRLIFEAILYRETLLCAWRELPSEFPPPAAIESQYRRWKKKGLIKKAFQFLFQ